MIKRTRIPGVTDGWLALGLLRVAGLPGGGRRMIRTPIALLMAAAGALVFCPRLPGAVAKMAFDAVPEGTGFSFNATYQENGIVAVSKSHYSSFGDPLNGTPTTALYFHGTGEYIEFSVVGGGSFDLLSFDLVSNGYQSRWIETSRSGGTLPIGLPVTLTHLEFSGSPYTDITWFRVGTPWFATEVDNIVVSAGPPPPVFVAYPTNGAMQVPTNTVITATFDQAMNEATINAGSFMVVDKAQAPVPGLVAYNASSFQASFTPSSGLTASNTYSVTVTTNVQSASGASRLTNSSWIFSTVGMPRIISNSLAIGANDATYDNQDLMVSGAVVTIDGSHTFARLAVVNGGTLTHSPAPSGEPNNRLVLTIAQDMTIDSSSRVDVSGKGYGSYRGPASGATHSTFASGAGYGGTGGDNSSRDALGGVGYGLATEPSDLGSGGGNAFRAQGGAGGGAIRLTVNGTFMIQGSVVASGLVGGVSSEQWYNYGGGGAGGSVLLTVGTLAGAGTIGANGGAGGHGYCGGGGGGRIAIYCGSNGFVGSISACGAGSGIGRGGASTIYTRAAGQEVGDLLLSNGGVFGGRTPCVGLSAMRELRIRSGASLILANGDLGAMGASMVIDDGGEVLINTNTLAHFGSLRVLSNGIIGAVLGQTNSHLVVTGNACVDSGGAISLNGKGYGAGAGPAPGASHSTYGAGAGYGGAGGDNSTRAALGGWPYGSATEPTALGSGGGNAFRAQGGAGGGTLRLTVNGTLIIQGSVAANGLVGGVSSEQWYNYGGGGAGGSVLLTAGTLAGSGVIAANGGAGGHGYCGGGSGGRIAIYSAANVFEGAITTSAGGSRGEPGTILLRNPSEDWSLSLNKQVLGRLRLIHQVELWTFPAVAGQVVQLIQVNCSAPGVGFSLLGPGGWLGFTNLAGPSDFLQLPGAGLFTLQVRSTEAPPEKAYTFRLQEVVKTSLSLGSVYTGSIIGSGQAQLFRIDLPTGQPVRIRLTDTHSGNRNELYAAFGVAPTRGSFDYRFAQPGAASQDLVIPSPTSGSWYVLVYAESVLTPGDFSLLVSASDVLVTRVSPRRSGNIVRAQLAIEGAGYGTDTQVGLVASNGNSFPAPAVDVQSPSQLLASFAPHSVPPGLYSVRVAKPGGDSDTLTNAFEVFEGGQPKLETRLVVPSFVGFHANATLYVEYANTGDAPMPAPLLVVHGSNRALLTLDPSKVSPGFWTHPTPIGFSDTVQIWGSGQMPGILQPGESFRVPVYYTGVIYPAIVTPTLQFDLGVLTAENAEAVDWTALKDSLKPASVSAEAWDVVWSNYRSQVGATWGDYVQKLSENAGYLAPLGGNVKDVSQILAFQFLQAEGLSVLRTLASATDAAVEAPGLPIAFTRTFPATISGRFELGPLGRGWSHNWQYSLMAAHDVPERPDQVGTVTILGPGGSRRVFQADSRRAGAYFSQAGDHGTLTNLSGGGFVLREPTGLQRVFRADGKLDYVEDSNRNRITAGYSGDLLTTLTHSAGQWLRIGYNAQGRIQSLADHLGRQTLFTHDGAGEHLVGVRYDDGRALGYDYGAAAPAQHALTSIAFPDGTHRAYTYESHGWLAGTSRDGGTEAITFTAVFGQVTATDLLGHASRYYFDHRGLLLKTEDPLTNTVRMTFDDSYNLVTMTDPAGLSHSYGYDSRGNLITSRDPLGSVSRFTYLSSLNRLATVTDARSNTTSYAYTPNGNLRATTYADGSVEGWAYDAVGNASTWTNRRGRSISYAYDLAGHLTNKAYADGSRTAYFFDARGNLTNTLEFATNLALIRATAYTHDANDRLTNILHSDGKWLAFTYDPAGRRASSLDQTGHWLGYHYDSAGRLASLTNELGVAVVRYQYDLLGRLEREILGNGVFSTYDYDAAGQLLRLTNALGGGDLLSFFNYLYDNRGRRTEMDTRDGRWTYRYDALGQLTNAVFASRTNDISNQDLTYIYDALGNRIRTIENGVTTEYTANNLNQYVWVGATNYVFDRDGNLIAEVTTNGTQRITNTVYGYSDENRLTVVRKGLNEWNYAYDAVGNRTVSELNGARTHYVTDPTGLGNIVAEYDGTGALMARYDHGLGLLSRTDAASQMAYHAFDGNGNTLQLVTTAGVVANDYAYMPFGSLLRRTETTPNRFGLTGQFGVLKAENGLDFMRARAFDSVLGRFLSFDPMGLPSGFPNHYRYSFNSPINAFDPSGLLTESEELGSIRTSVKELIREANQKGVWWGPFENLGATFGLKRDPWVCYVWQANVKAKLAQLDLKHWKVIEDGWWIKIPKTDAYVGFHHFITIESDKGQRYRIDPWLFGSKQMHIPWSHYSEAVAFAMDPNMKTGPTGLSPSGYLYPPGVLAYRVDFENDTNASAPAQQVIVTDPLNSNLDWGTLQWTEVGWGDQFIVVPANAQHFETNVPMTFNGVSFEVQVELGLHSGNGQAYAVFRSVDPVTGLPPAVEYGFLPPEDGTGRGMGHVSYTIQPKAGLPTGTQIRNVAVISFDNQLAIATNQRDPHNPAAGTDPAKECLNTIDAGPPASQVRALPATTNQATFLVEWTGQDDANGSGIGSYDIVVSTNNGPWTAWLNATTNTGALFTGERNHTYRFYSIARDNVGWVETAPVVADASILVEVNANRPPQAGDDSVECEMNGTVRLRVLKLLDNDTDPEDDPLTLTWCDSASASNGVVTCDGVYVTYRPPLNFAGTDRFHYTVSDGRGGSATATVTATVTDSTHGQSANIKAIRHDPDGTVRISFMGIAGRTYGIEMTSDLAQPHWQRIAERVAGPDGGYEFQENVGSGSRFYRAVWP